MKTSFNNFLKTSDGEQIFYTTNFKPGKAIKNVLVFNYGLVCSNFHWSKQIDFFDELGFDILLHDYRGHYQSSGKHDISKVTFNRIALDLNELVSFLKLENIVLLGHSMGVNVCLEYSKLYQENVQSMILISGTIVPVFNIMLDTHLTAPVRPLLSSLLSKYPKSFNTFWKFGGWNPIVRKFVHSGGFNVDEVSDEFIEIYLNKLGELGPELFFQLLDQMQDHDALAFTHKITTRTLIVGGNSDKVIPNFLQKLMHSKLTNSELYIMHKGSHVPQVDFPNFVNERMEHFIGQTI
jgi:pimeloyl-ACP methyl ester carboxylesterase